MTPFEQGQQAGREGKTFADMVPAEFIIGRTKLGAPKLGEAGEQWLDGYHSTYRRGPATKQEREAAAAYDVSRFRRKSNRYYK